VTNTKRCEILTRIPRRQTLDPARTLILPNALANALLLLGRELILSWRVRNLTGTGFITPTRSHTGNRSGENKE